MMIFKQWTQFLTPKTQHTLPPTTRNGLAKPTGIIVDDANHEHDWQQLIEQPSAERLEQQLAYYQQLLQHPTPQPIATLRHAWCEWLSGCLLPLEGLGLCQRILDDQPHLHEARYFLSFYQWQCGLYHQAANTMNDVAKKAPCRSWLFTKSRATLLEWSWSNPYKLNSLTCSVAIATHWSNYHLARLIRTFSPMLASTASVAPLGSLGTYPSQGLASNHPPQLSNNEAVKVMPVQALQQRRQTQKQPEKVRVAEPNTLTEQVDSVEVLKSKLEVQPSNTNLLFQLGVAFHQQGSAMSALYYFKKCISLMPHHAKSYYHMGQTLKKLNDWEGVAEAYKSAISFSSDPHWTGIVSLELAKVYMEELKDPDKALSCLKLGNELSANTIETLFSEAEQLCKQGEFRAAIALYSELSTLQPENADIYSFLGYLHWQLGDVPEAEEAYQQAITLDSCNAIAMNNLGVLYMDIEKQYDKALYWFNQAAKADTSYTMAQFNLGRVYERMDKLSDAIQAYQHALRLNQHRPELEADELNHRIRRLL
ncbi:MAG: tetratricopeptide repeat protein [Vampirovibrionales bacterium]